MFKKVLLRIGIAPAACAVLVTAVLAGAGAARALTVDEILRLKKAGVSDETIQMLIEQEYEEKAAADYLGRRETPEGTVIRSTGKRPRPASPPPAPGGGYYPGGVYPFIKVAPPGGPALPPEPAPPSEITPSGVPTPSEPPPEGP